MLASTLLAATLAVATSSAHPLYDAACQGQLPQVKRLLATEAGRSELDAIVSEDYGVDDSPLGCAVSNRHVQVVQVLLQARADPNLTATRSPLTIALEKAEAPETVELVRLLLAAGAHADELDGAPLERAAASGDVRLVKLLVAAGAKPAGPRGDCRPAVAAGGLEALAFLVEHGGGCAASPAVLAQACAGGDEAAVRYLLDHGAKPTTRDGSGATALLSCLGAGTWPRSRAAVELLVARGADLKARDADGLDALYRAAERSEERAAELVQWLLGKGLDPRPECGPIFEHLYGETAVKRATLVRDAGCTLAAHGGTLLRHAARIGDLALVRWALASAVPVDDADKDGRTALHLAAEHRHEEELQALLQAGADPRRKDAAGRDAFALGRDSSLALQKLLGTDELSRLRREPLAAIILYGAGKSPEDAQAAQQRYGEQAKVLAPVIALADGFPARLRSDDVAGLRPGYHIVVLGYCLQTQVEEAVKTLRTFFPDVYSRPVQVKLDAPACPTVTLPLKARKAVQVPEGGQLTVSVLSLDPPSALEVESIRPVLLHAALTGKDGQVLASQDVDAGPGWDTAQCALTLTPARGTLTAALRCSGGMKDMCAKAPYSARWTFAVQGSEIAVDEKDSGGKTLSCGE